MSRSEFDKWCRRGDREALAAALAGIADPLAREKFYTSVIKVAESCKPGLARHFGELYVDEFYEKSEPFGAEIGPDVGILQRLVQLYEYEGAWEMAAWVCEFAVAFGIADDGTPTGYAGRAARNREKAAMVERVVPNALL
jgi:hypothetical protein